jgi:hypothetical protein
MTLSILSLEAADVSVYCDDCCVNHCAARGFLNSIDIQVKEDIALEEIQLAERIGRGNFGEVYKGVWNGTVVAGELNLLIFGMQLFITFNSEEN